MSCGGCVNSLTRVLKTVPGIEPLKIEVGKAALRIDTDKVDRRTVRAAVEAPGSRSSRGVTCLPGLGHRARRAAANRIHQLVFPRQEARRRRGAGATGGAVESPSASKAATRRPSSKSAPAAACA